MKLTGKKIALGCLAGVLAVTGLTGCSSKIDGTKTVVTVDGGCAPGGGKLSYQVSAGTDAGNV